VSGCADGDYAAAQRRSLEETAHRQWPVPDGPWIQGQTWCDLLFAHWSLPPEALRQVVPAELPLDTFDGRAWLGITPFEVRGLRLRGTPPLPGISRFPETNVRTYVTLDGKPGIYFLALHAGSRLAVEAARRTYRVPYFHARMAIERTGDAIAYSVARRRPDASLALTYRPAGARHNAQPGSLEYFLIERYCLYTLDERRRVLRGDIHHPPWPLHPASATIERNTMTAPYAFDLPDEEPLLHFAHRQDVVIWPLKVHRG
jgi:uncharacterized protein YqjF (DUF2071 family)